MEEGQTEKWYNNYIRPRISGGTPEILPGITLGDWEIFKNQNAQGGDPRFYELLHQIGELHGKKNTDYAKGGTQGHLGNFIRVSEIKKLYPGLDWSSPLGTALDYMLKRLDAALILESTGRASVTGEGIGERLKDVATYALLGILLQEDKHGTL